MRSEAEPSCVIRSYDVVQMTRDDDMRFADRLMARDQSALRELMGVYGGVVFGMAKRVLLDPNMAEEVAQDAFVALWRRPGAYDPARGSLQAFLLGVTRNKAIDLVRKEETVKRTKDSLTSELVTASKETSPHEGLVEREQVRDALRALTDVQREAVVLAYFGGRTYREVAEELGIPEGTAKTRLRDGLTHLRQLMVQTGERE